MATQRSVGETLRINRSDKNKGWQMNLDVVKYDNGMWMVNGRPSDTLAGASVNIAMALVALERKKENVKH